MKIFNIQLAAFLLCLGFVSNSPAHVLLGDLTVHSYLKQPLHATIEIENSHEIQRNLFKVEFASEEDNRRAGITPDENLRFLRLRLEQRANSVYYIGVYSVEKINTPFMTVLIDVTMPGQRVLKQYSIYLDAGCPMIAVPAVDNDL